MTQAAVPAYLGTNFDTAPPGHRFTLYLEAWQEDFTLNKNNKMQAIKQALPLPDAGKALDALRVRQAVQAQSLGAEIFDATTTAPFATGLGMEHPLENGFAFLNPYGLPYLPGSGVKGVLRAAARELASGEWGKNGGWDKDRTFAVKIGKDEAQLSLIDLLFGRETAPGDKRHYRGALTFWDVIPTLPGNKMRLDVMTPHQGHYYQDGKTPHDSGQPIPIPFLAVPPGAQFRFIVTCERKYLKDDTLKGDGWKTLLKAAFEHAYEWLGFGAKTAVGYGAMARDPKAEQEREHERQQREEQARRQAEEARRAAALATMSPVDRKIAEAIEAKQQGQSDDSAVFNAIKVGRFDAGEVREAAEKLKAMMQDAKSWKESSFAKKPEKDKEHQRTLQVMNWLSTDKP